MSDLLAQLNPEQRAAVTLPEHPALILAGAGSGKTRVLTTRIAWLIQTGQVSPAGILAVTFTNKAAREMTTRLSAMLPVNTRSMWIGTFHGLCNRFLRAHYRDAGLPQTFQILDSADQLSAIKRLLKARGINDEHIPPRQLAWFINGAKDQGLRPSEVEANDDFNLEMVELYREYDRQCQREGVVDFAELLLRCFELLARNASLREHYQRRFRHILVDEFQDTNVLQYRWLKLLAAYGEARPNAVFAVGDDDQSIYAFRGANVANMAHFENEFKVGNIIRLEQNYRSHGHILDAANVLIKQNHARLGKTLWTAAGQGEPVRVCEAGSDNLEAQWVVDEVRTLVAEGSLRSEIAVLYRSNAQSRVLEHVLFGAGIPYRVYGGLRFFERMEVKHALAYLRMLANPHDDTAFLRVVNFPTRGIGARSIEQLQDVALARGVSLFAATPFLDGKAGSAVGGFVRLIEALRFEISGEDLAATIDMTLQRSGLIEHYQREKEGEDRIANLKELVNAASAFLAEAGLDYGAPAQRAVTRAGDESDGESSDRDETLQAAPGGVDVITPLDAFLAHASLEAGDNQAQEGQDALQLMTVHSAKGLEFDSVFITGLEEGLFPHENSLNEADGTEEERRLMYVAITRARQRLYLSFSQTRMLHGQTRYSIKSRFISELPEGTLRWLAPRLGYDGYGGSGGRGTTGRGSSGSAGYGDARSSGDHYAKVSEASPAWGVARHSAESGFRVGQNVAHARFGEGVILKLEGSGGDARAQINFGRQGTKWLALSIAKLEPA